VHHRALGLIIVGLSLLAGAAPASAAGTPGAVSIRVEGGASTLVPLTSVTTTTAPVDKSGTSCPGTTVGGALQAVDPTWSGTVDPNFGSGAAGQTLEVIKGESHTFAGGTYYSIYVNGRPSDFGVCTTEVNPGDSILIYAACAGASSGCTGGSPLTATAPATVAPGAPFTVTVTESTTSYDPNPPYASTTTDAPAADATVAGGGLAAQTGADGKATLSTSARGPLTLLVTMTDRVRQALSVCVTDGGDGYCGTSTPGTPAAPAAPAAPCATNGHDGRCGTIDQTAPDPAIRGLREQARFRHGHGPDKLTGTVAADPSGLKDVRLRLTRTLGRSCTVYDGALERLVRTRVCGVKGGRSFSVGAGTDWSYLLPAVLPRGRYVLDVIAVDRAGNTSRVSARGRDRIVFFVS
jgi:hypothetical protein